MFWVIGIVKFPYYLQIPRPSHAGASTISIRLVDVKVRRTRIVKYSSLQCDRGVGDYERLSNSRGP